MTYKPHNHNKGIIIREKKKKFFSSPVLALSLILGLIGAAVLAVVSFFFHSPWFYTNSVSVSAARLTSSSLVYNSVVESLVKNGGIRSILGPGHIFFWYQGSGEHKIPKLPEVLKVKVSADFFAKDAFIEVEERKVFGVLCKPRAEKCFALDRNGVPFFESPESEGGLILLITDLTPKRVVLGEKYEMSAGWLENIVETLLVMSSKGFVPKDVRIEELGTEEWKAVFPSGPSFFFSFRFIPQNFSGIMEDISERADLSLLEYFDFRVPNRIYYK